MAKSSLSLGARASAALSTLQYAARAKLIVCDPHANIVGGEEDAKRKKEREAAEKAEKKKAGPKHFDFLPRFIRSHQEHVGTGAKHGPRRDWLSGEERREAVLGVPGGSPPRQV